MRDKLGVLLMEDANGDVAVQLFANPDAMAASFAELKGHLGEPRRRATFLDLRYLEGGLKVAKSESREIPDVSEPSGDGYVIGEGPRKPKEEG